MASRKSLSRRAFAALASGALTLIARPRTARAQGPRDVDLELVLAVDTSGSINAARFELQKQGYVAAFRDPQVIRAVQSGMLGEIAVTMFQWTGPFLHSVAVDWTRLHDAASCNAFADRIGAAPRALFGGGTSLSGAIDRGVDMFADTGFRGMRRVIDVSADGANNRGRPVAQARDAAVVAGVTVNGLPILALEFDLDDHFASEVIGGPGAFMIPAKSFETFGEAVRRKLILEIAGLAPGGAQSIPL